MLPPNTSFGADPTPSAAPPPGADPNLADAAGRPEPFRRALIVANPVAGSGQGARAARELAEGLKQRGVRVEVHLTRARGDGARAVVDRDPATDLVVSVGGDGTLREVLAGLKQEPGLPILLLPLGTANVLSLDLGLTRDVDRALELVDRRHTARIDVAEINGQLSFLVTGVGLDARVVQRVEDERRGPISKWTYVRAGLRSLRGFRPPKLTVWIDGERLDGEFGQVLISNIVHYGGALKLKGMRARDDGLFEVYLFPNGHPLALARTLLASSFRSAASLATSRSCKLVSARRVRVEADGEAPVQVDGDFFGTTPVDLQVTDRRHVLLVP